MGAGMTFSAKGSGKVARRLARVPPALKERAHRTMEVAVRLTEGDLKAHALTGKKGQDAFWGVTGATGDALGVRTGHTRRSIATAVFGAFPAGVVGTVGSALRQMKLHEEGGTITGKPWLRIPTRVMQRPGSGTDALAGKSARSLPNTFILKSKSGNLWIAEGGTPRAKLAQELNGVPLLLYMLVHSITLRARRPFAGTLARVRGRVGKLFGAMFTATVRGS